jgi:hypothetical protein
MKCPKCGYVSFPYLESCRQCGQGLAGQHAAFGLYALRPEPPDLWLAYQALEADAATAPLASPLPTAAIDLGQLDEIELDLADADDSTQGTPQGGGQAGDAMHARPTPALEPTLEEELPPEIVIPQSLDLGELGDIALEIEDTAALGSTSPPSLQPPTEPSETPQVYDLDLDEKLEGLTLGSTIQESGTDDDDEEIAEYTLEIEDELELEIDELESEEDDEAEDDDDDHHDNER